MKTKIRNKIRNDSPMSVFIIGRWPMPGLCSGFGKASEHDWQQVCGSVSYLSFNDKYPVCRMLNPEICLNLQFIKNGFVG